MTPSLQTKLASGMVTLCRVWRITRADGTVLRFTDNDSAVIANAVLFSASCGLACSAIELVEGLEPPNMEVTGIFDSSGITVADYLAGKYNMAKVELGLADWKDPTEPVMWLLVGGIGEFARDRLGFKIQLSGMTYLINRKSAEATTPLCRARLGDARCKVVMSSITITTTVAVVTSRREFTVAATSAIGHLQYGICKFTSGANVGRSMEIKAQQTGTGIELYLPMPYDVALGDVVQLLPGCDLSIATCNSKFSNVVNFRGEPYLPGADSMTENQKNFV
jgi:uncharacterized phage protein (TIGR02218 family)